MGRLAIKDAAYPFTTDGCLLLIPPSRCFRATDRLAIKYRGKRNIRNERERFDITVGVEELVLVGYPGEIG